MSSGGRDISEPLRNAITEAERALEEAEKINGWLSKVTAVLEIQRKADDEGKRIIFTMEPRADDEVPTIVYLSRERWERIGRPDRILVACSPVDEDESE